MSFKSKFAFKTTTAAALAVLGFAAHSEQVTKISGAPGHTVWRIVEPKVTQARTEYPQITFTPGSLVTVSAEGCVQTGGIGLTWKRYTAPAGPNSASLYHGQIFIPGAEPGLQFLAPRQPTVYTIPVNASIPAGQNHLVLGYTDDTYGDNGYSGHDDGTSNQCWNVGAASLTIDIQPAPHLEPPPPTASYVLTLEDVMVRRTRSRVADTDVLAAGVVVNGTQSAVARQGVGDWKQGNHPIAFPIEITDVAPTDRINVAYTIVNAGNPGEQGIDDAVADAISGIANLIPGAGSFIAGAAKGWQKIFPLIDPNCDGPVVGDAVMGTGTDFAHWTQQGPMRRTVLVPGVDSPTGCGSNSYYEVTYSIARVDQGSVRPYSLQVNARSFVAKAALNAVLLKKH